MLITRQSLEQFQVIIYLAALVCGMVIGALFSHGAPLLDALLWPVLGVLLYATFAQIPLTHSGEAFINTHFLAAAVVGNFILLPFVVGGLMLLAPAEPAIRLGMLLVLLVPCTDWFITFTHLSGGDTRQAIAFTPISLLLQIVLLPVYLWIFLGTELVVTLAQDAMLIAFIGLILLPLLAAYLTEKWVGNSQERRGLLHGLAWLPVPLLAIVIFLVAATQVSVIVGATSFLGWLLLLFVAFLFVAGVIARVLTHWFALTQMQGRTLAFSLGTRNSFVVLPLALALPHPFDWMAVVIVFQSLVELLGMVVFLWWVPKRLFPLSP